MILFVRYEVGMIMVIQQIERYGCPSIESKDLLGKK